MKHFQQLLLALSLLLCSQLCSYAQSVTMEFDNATSIMSKTQGFFEALEAGDMDGLLSLFADDAMIYGITKATSEMTKSEFKAHMDYMKDNYTNATVSNLAILPLKSDSGFTKGEWTLVWCIVEQADKKTGAKLEYPMHLGARWEDGKIVFLEAYVDALNIRESLGYELTTASN